MAAKAVDARTCLNRNHRFRGHGPLLQGRGVPPHRPVFTNLTAYFIDV
jgi:hypothetical protein